MKIDVDPKVLSKISLMVCTPCYGGVVLGAHMQSMIKLQSLLAKYGVSFTVNHLYSESLITRARTYMTDAFMRSSCTHLLFIDADIQFNADDVLFLMALQTQNDSKNDYDIVGGAYPKKTLSYEKMVAAVKSGACDQDPSRIMDYVGDYVFNPILEGGKNTFPISEPLEVAELGTGFMLIRRATFEKWEAAHPERKYHPDHARTKDFDGHREIYLYFDAAIEPETKRFLSEDYLLCHEVRKLGMHVWLCPWMQLIHHGTLAYGGSLAALGSIGAVATADPAAVKKM